MANDQAIMGALMQIAGDDSSGDDVLGEMLGELLGEDIAGDDSSGDDSSGDLAVLGAALQAGGPKGRALLKRMVTARKLAGSQVLTGKGPVSSGVQPIGFNQAAIAAGTQATITTQPQTWFKPMRLIVGESIAPFFTIDNIICGNKSQLPAATSLPAEAFIPQAQAVVLDLDTVNPALNLTLLCTNISGVAQNFRAMFVGKEVSPL
jgi:hypothetical protein